MERIKRYFIKKWINEYIDELSQVSLICSQEQYNDIVDIKGDLNICEEVFNRYYSIIDM